MDRDHFWLNVRQFALLVPHSADEKPRVDDRRVISGIVYVLLNGIHALTDFCCRPIRFLLTGGMRPIATGLLRSPQRSAGNTPQLARFASIGRGYDPWDMSTSRSMASAGLEASEHPQMI